MAGRHAKPIALHLADGKKHLTKAEIAARQKQEEGLRTYAKYHPNDKVKQCPAALRMFEKLKKLYKEIDYVDGLDENIINRYCLMTVEADKIETLIACMTEDVDNCEEPSDRIALYKTISSAEITLNKLRDMLLKLEDRLFLNPTARIKNVPKKQEEKPPESRWDKFRGGGMSG